MVKKKKTKKPKAIEKINKKNINEDSDGGEES